MKVEELMTTDVGTCRPYDAAVEAAKVMWEQDCGAVPVVDQDGRVVAVVTDRDLCIAAFTQGRTLGDIRVSSAMSRKLWTCRPDEELPAAEKTMRMHQVRRLPVVDVEGRLVGILSLSDLARQAMSAKRSRSTASAGSSSKKKGVVAADVGETLGAISTPGSAA